MSFFRRHSRDDIDVASVLANLGRLDAVAQSGLMGAPRSERLDALTQSAATQLRTPIALMSILDDSRIFYLSATGLTGPAAEAREDSTDASYCQYVVATEHVFAVEDSLTDDWVKDHPATRAGAVRAYLGVPIRRDGHTLGSFCVADTEPRQWTDADVVALQNLAETAMAQANV